jgi:hypothetical protein
MIKKYIIFLLIIVTVPMITFSAVGRWEKSMKISGYYGFESRIDSQEWRGSLTANFIRYKPSSQLGFINSLTYGEARSISAGTIQPTSNDITVNIYNLWNISSFNYWRIFHITIRGPIIVTKRIKTTDPSTGEEIEVESPGKERELSTYKDLSFILISTYGKNFSRYLNGEAGLEIIDGNGFMRLSSSYNKPLGYRTNMYLSVAFRTNGRNSVIMPGFTLNYKFSRRISLVFMLYEPYDFSANNFVDEKRTLDLTYEFFY